MRKSILTTLAIVLIASFTYADTECTKNREDGSQITPDFRIIMKDSEVVGEAGVRDIREVKVMCREAFDVDELAAIRRVNPEFQEPEAVPYRAIKLEEQISQIDSRIQQIQDEAVAEVTRLSAEKVRVEALKDKVVTESAKVSVGSAL